jgi:hypothetical protein
MARIPRKPRTPDPRIKAGTKKEVNKDLGSTKTKIYFYYERMEPMSWPEPRDIRMQLSTKIKRKYNNSRVSKIPLSTEVILKEFRNEIKLKYKVVLCEWDIGMKTREMKEITFNPKMFAWTKEDQDFGVVQDAF